ncbi:MAG TPA: class I SAM-dependent methyltransferase [Acidobacteriaceae bacterium]|nr:class I SAM-dependent methyltransferase [Acidobacteriaceae bacterium]
MQPTDGMSAPPNPGIIFDMLQAHQRTAALRAAIELDLFRAVGEGPGDAASIAKKCSSSERGIRILCDFLAMSGILSKENGQYKHSATSALFLDSRSPASLASVAQFLGNPALCEPFNNLAGIVRNGRTSLPGEGTVEPDNPVWVQFAESMAPLAATGAAGMATIALGSGTGPMRVLDIAAGHGLYGIAVAQQNPQAQITGLDWPAVLAVAERNAQKAGVADRFTKRPGSAFDLDFGGPYDIVLLTNFLHHFDPPTCIGLLKKIRAAMKAGGRLATLEFVPNDDRVSPPMAAAFSMTMLATTASGDAYTFNQLKQMYEAAGFKDVTMQAIPMNPQTVVVGIA